ncbi:MAG: hypothetical protein ACE5LU_08975 [Anaerolineae bacterium]
MTFNQDTRGSSGRHWPRFLAHGAGLLVTLLFVGWAGRASWTTAGLPAAKLTDGAVPAYSFGNSTLATITPTVPLTPTTTAPPFVEEPTVYLPLIQRQMIIPGSLSIEEVYTTNYDGGRLTTFQPCQAVVLWIRMRNDAEIAQPATLYWQTADPEGEAQANLGARRQLNVPPGESTWRFVGAPDLDVPAGEYRFEAWFTSGTDRQELAVSFTVEGEPMPFHFLGGQTAAIDTRDYGMTVPKEIVPRRVYANLPARITDAFTFEDSDVVQITTWEGVTKDSYVETHRFRPNGTHFGVLIRQWRDFEIRPSCVRSALAYWEIDSWMKQAPGQWHLDIYGGDHPGSDAQFVGRLYFTLQEGEGGAFEAH